MSSGYLALVNGIPTMTAANVYVSIYEQEVTPGAITAGTPVTLPASETYQGLELEVYLNNIQLTHTDDYTYVGAGPTYTQVQFTFDLVATDVIKFRIDRSP